MSKTQQMRNRLPQLRGVARTATGLATEMGWSTLRAVKRFDGDGKEYVVSVHCASSKAALRIAKKLGADVAHAKPNDPYSIRFF